MKYLYRLSGICVLLSLSACVFTVEHEMMADPDAGHHDDVEIDADAIIDPDAIIEPDTDADDPDTDDPDPDPDPSIQLSLIVTHQGSTVDDGDPIEIDNLEETLNLDFNCTTVPEDAGCTVECAVIFFDESPTQDNWDFGCGLSEENPLSTQWPIEAEQDVVIHYRAHLTDYPETETTPQSHTISTRFAFDINTDDLPAEELFYADQGEFIPTCSSPLSTEDEGNYDCDFSCELDTGESPEEVCTEGVLDLDLGANESAPLTITACHPFFEDHCTTEVFEYTLVQPTWKSVSSGKEHTCAILDDDTLWCWGNSSNGRLGLGNITSVETNIPNRIDGHWKEVSAGDAHTCSIDLNDALYCWGQSSEGQVDPASLGIFTEPNLVDDSYSWNSVAAGGTHTCALSTDNELFCWGRNIESQLGPDPQPDALSPIENANPTDWWINISAGYQHNCAIDNNGDAVCWGDESSNQLGHNSGSQLDLIGGDFGSPDILAITIYAGARHTCALSNEGVTYCWGDNVSDQLGHTNAITDIPQDLDQYFPKITAGGAHSCGIDENDNGYCWGSQANGQLGNGMDDGSTNSPQELLNHDFLEISAGDQHTCGIELSGTLYCWGLSSNGRLGIGTPGSDRISTPTPITWSHDFPTPE